jgi:transcriptional regulator with XRE-family HTH domain
MATSADEKVTKRLSNALKKKREELGFTQDEVAKMSGLKSNYYAKIERGEINITIKKIDRIIKALKVDASEIFPV